MLEPAPPAASLSKFIFFSPRKAGNHSPSCIPSEGGKQGQKHPAVLLPPSESRRWRSRALFRDTWRNHNFLETSHLLELGGCSDRQGWCSIGSIRYSVQSEPRSHRGICEASSGKSCRAQEVPRLLQAGLHPPPCPRCSSQQRCPFHSHFPQRAGGCGGVPRSPWIQALHPNPPSILQIIPCLWRKASPDVPSAPTAFPHSSLSCQLFPPFPYWSQFPSLTGSPAHQGQWM